MLGLLAPESSPYMCLLRQLPCATFEMTCNLTAMNLDLQLGRSCLKIQLSRDTWITCGIQNLGGNRMIVVTKMSASSDSGSSAYCPYYLCPEVLNQARVSGSMKIFQMDNVETTG